MKSGSLRLLKPSGPVQVCTGIALPCSTNRKDERAQPGHILTLRCCRYKYKMACFCSLDPRFFLFSPTPSAICFARPFLVFGGSSSFGETQNLYHMFGRAALSIVNFTADLPVLVNAQHHATERWLSTYSAACNSNSLEIEWRDVTCRHYNTVFKLLVPASSPYSLHGAESFLRS